jgi:hypothetical protein
MMMITMLLVLKLQKIAMMKTLINKNQYLQRQSQSQSLSQNQKSQKRKLYVRKRLLLQRYS